jgi:hypothetical protein
MVNDRFSSVLGESLGRFTYEYNPCYGFSYGYSGCNIGGDTVAACQSADFEDFSCGKMSTETFLLFSGNQNNQLYYSGGDDGRETTVELICDRNAETPKLVAYDDYPSFYSYRFALTTKCACPGLCGDVSPTPAGEEEDISGAIGIVLIVLSVCGLVTYFVVGIIIKRVKFDKTGLEMIPNYNFWKDLPFLIKDGVLFVYHSIAGLFRKGRGKDYEAL